MRIDNENETAEEIDETSGKVVMESKKSKGKKNKLVGAELRRIRIKLQGFFLNYELTLIVF